MLQEAISRLDPEVSVFVTGPRPEIVRSLTNQEVLNWHQNKSVGSFILCLELVSPCFFLQEGKYHLRRCIDSGLWVPDSGEGDDEKEDDEEDEDEEED